MYVCGELPLCASFAFCGRYLIPDLPHVDAEVLEDVVRPALQSRGVLTIPATLLPGAPPVAGWLVLASQVRDVKQAWDVLAEAE
jgi:hypothetical protein